MKIKSIDGKIALEISPEELKVANATNDLATDIAQCLYDAMGMNPAIVACIAIMANLLHSKHAGDPEGFMTEVERVRVALACSPVAFADSLQVVPERTN